MHIFAFGINHKTAPLALRERTIFAPEKLPEALRDFTSKTGIGEATILSTCNRTELYCGPDDGDQAGSKQAIEWFCNYHILRNDLIQPYLYFHPGQGAVKHAFRVASGLDSMILGEPQILGQMKEAFATAHKAGVTGKILNKLFQQTFSVAKQVRTDTAIGASAVSIASAAVTLAKQIFNKLSEQTVLLIGAGDMINLTARHLREENVGHMIVANRTLERARLLAEPYQAETITLLEMPARLHEADIVISCTASQLPILGKGAVESALKIRKHRPMFMVDIAVPRDIEVEVGELDDIYLYTVDDLKDVVQENLQSRQQAAKQAEKIIDLEVVNFMHWIKSLDSVPTIRALREATDNAREAELMRAKRQLANGEDPQLVLERLSRALANKFTHAPTSALQKADHDGNNDLLEAARRLFNLSEDIGKNPPDEKD